MDLEISTFFYFPLYNKQVSKCFKLYYIEEQKWNFSVVYDEILKLYWNNPTPNNLYNKDFPFMCPYYLADLTLTFPLS